MWTREGQNMFELRISDSSSSIIFDQCSHRYSRSGYSQMSTNKNLYWTVLLAKILTTCKISLSFFILISAIFLIAIGQSRVSKRSLYQTVPSTIEWFRPSLLFNKNRFILDYFQFSFNSSLFAQLNIFEQMKKMAWCVVVWMHGEIKGKTSFLLFLDLLNCFVKIVDIKLHVEEIWNLKTPFLFS